MVSTARSKRLVEQRANGLERSQFNVKNFPGFGEVAHGGILPAMPENFNREAASLQFTAGGKLLCYMRQSFIVGADAGGQGARSRLQKRRGEAGHFPGQPVKGGVGQSQDGAVHIGDNIRRARSLIKQRHFAKNIPRTERGQNGLPVANHRPRPKLATHDEKHGVTRFALPDHHGVLHDFLEFQKIREMRQLGVLHVGKDFNPAQRTRLEAGRRRSQGKTARSRSEKKSFSSLMSAAFCQTPPLRVKIQVSGQDPLVADPVNQNRQWHGPIGRIVNSPDEIIVDGCLWLHAAFVSRPGKFASKNGDVRTWSARTSPRFGTPRHVAGWESGDTPPQSKSGRDRITASVRVGIRAEDLDEVAMCAEPPDGFGYFRVFKMPGTIYEEKNTPTPCACSGADSIFVRLILKRRNAAMASCNAPTLSENADHQARTIIAGWWTALTAKHEKARRIRSVVLDVLLQNLHTVFFRRQNSGNRRRVFFVSRPVPPNVHWTRSR